MVRNSLLFTLKEIKENSIICAIGILLICLSVNIQAFVYTFAFYPAEVYELLDISVTDEVFKEVSNFVGRSGMSTEVARIFYICEITLMTVNIAIFIHMFSKDNRNYFICYLCGVNKTQIGLSLLIELLVYFGIVTILSIPMLLIWDISKIGISTVFLLAELVIALAVQPLRIRRITNERV